jgi:hypothetical protein
VLSFLPLANGIMPILAINSGHQRLYEGLKIFTEQGEELSLETLSSGEKQLLLLFCNTVTARDRVTIFNSYMGNNVGQARRLSYDIIGYSFKSKIITFWYIDALLLEENIHYPHAILNSPAAFDIAAERS